jgi:hypothetical protein
MASHHLPEVKLVQPRVKSLRAKLSRSSTMLWIQVSLTASVTILNLAVLIWAAATHPLDSRGVATMYTGNCKTIGVADSITHLVLNGISSLFLGASNYGMQILAAPARRDLETAHAKGDWLEIGVPSLVNLFKLPRQMRFLWFCLGLISTLLHMV